MRYIAEFGRLEGGMVEEGLLIQVLPAETLQETLNRAFRYRERLIEMEVFDEHWELYQLLQNGRVVYDHFNGLYAHPDQLPFGLDPDALLEPFCACGRVISRCDRSRAGCHK